MPRKTRKQKDEAAAKKAAAEAAQKAADEAAAVEAAKKAAKKAAAEAAQKAAAEAAAAEAAKKAAAAEAAQKAADEAAAAKAAKKAAAKVAQMEKLLDSLRINTDLPKFFNKEPSSDDLSRIYIGNFSKAVAALHSLSEMDKSQLFYFGISKEYHLKHIKLKYEKTKTEIQRNPYQRYTPEEIKNLCANEDKEYEETVEECKKFLKGRVY